MGKNKVEVDKVKGKGVYVNVPIFLCGETGSGKTYSLRNLDDEKTLFINVENKPLPFTLKHTKTKIVTTKKEMDATLLKLQKSQAIDTVIIDSFTSYTEIIADYVNFKFSGYEQWKQHNSIIFRFIKKLKSLKQQVVILGIPEEKEDDASGKQYIKVKGRELRFGTTEKEFTIVLFTKPIYSEDDDDEEIENCIIQHRPNRKNTAKCPPGMLEKGISNDMQKIIKSVRDFYGGKNE